MTKRVKLIIIAVAVLIVGGAVAGEIWSLRRQVDREMRARADADRRVLEAAGWAKAKTGDVDYVTPDIPDQGTDVPGIGIGADTDWTDYGPGETEDQCPPAALPPATGDREGGGATPPASPPSISIPSIQVRGELQARIGVLADGTIMGTARLWATLRTPTWQDREELLIPPERFRLVVDKELRGIIDRGLERRQRFAFAPRPWRQWRTGWSAGAGLCADMNGSISACGAVMWGVQF